MSEKYEGVQRPESNNGMHGTAQRMKSSKELIGWAEFKNKPKKERHNIFLKLCQKYDDKELAEKMDAPFHGLQFERRSLEILRSRPKDMSNHENPVIVKKGGEPFI